MKGDEELRCGADLVYRHYFMDDTGTWISIGERDQAARSMRGDPVEIFVDFEGPSIIISIVSKPGYAGQNHVRKMAIGDNIMGLHPVIHEIIHSRCQELVTDLNKSIRELDKLTGPERDARFEEMVDQAIKIEKYLLTIDKSLKRTQPHILPG